MKHLYTQSMGATDFVPAWLKQFQKYAIPVGGLVLAGVAYLVLFKKRKS